ncbi:hypothetical protein NM688_g2226 [Phlebia brevispora]|uniref:Uncharacterized protein n=1 Tax=Phlebia brevispora TaxID=194682 RepID=A0ACC1T9G6_9APHY|nr:hypothetical protein NM688_g2226 [Phlebia brevispora]
MLRNVPLIPLHLPRCGANPRAAAVVDFYHLPQSLPVDFALLTARINVQLYKDHAKLDELNRKTHNQVREERIKVDKQKERLTALTDQIDTLNREVDDLQDKCHTLYLSCGKEQANIENLMREIRAMHGQNYETRQSRFITPLVKPTSLVVAQAELKHDQGGCAPGDSNRPL